MLQTKRRPESLAAAEKFKAHAESIGTTPVAWVLANPTVTSIIAGPRTLEQWRSYLPALDLVLTPANEDFVDGRVPPGHPSTPGYNDPAYPIEGRTTRDACPA